MNADDFKDAIRQQASGVYCARIITKINAMIGRVVYFETPSELVDGAHHARITDVMIFDDAAVVTVDYQVGEVAKTLSMRHTIFLSLSPYW